MNKNNEVPIFPASLFTQYIQSLYCCLEMNHPQLRECPSQHTAVPKRILRLCHELKKENQLGSWGMAATFSCLRLEDHVCSRLAQDT